MISISHCNSQIHYHSKKVLAYPQFISQNDASWFKIYVKKKTYHRYTIFFFTYLSKLSYSKEHNTTRIQEVISKPVLSKTDYFTYSSRMTFLEVRSFSCWRREASCWCNRCSRRRSLRQSHLSRLSPSETAGSPLSIKGSGVEVTSTYLRKLGIKLGDKVFFFQYQVTKELRSILSF